MGAFSNMDYELQNSEAAVSDSFTEDGDMDMLQTVSAEPATGGSSPDTEPAPATAVSEPSAVSDTQSEDEARRAHEAAEAKRKAEWDARRAEKQRAEQVALEKLDAMSPAELLKAAAKRVSADTEKLTRRNMKESVSEFIQTKCIDDLGFARLTMHPRKSIPDGQSRRCGRQVSGNMANRTGKLGDDHPQPVRCPHASENRLLKGDNGPVLQQAHHGFSF